MQFPNAAPWRSWQPPNVLERANSTCKRCASDTTIPTYLPHNMYLKAESEDLVNLQAVIDFRLKRESAIKQRKHLSTNKSEALHRCVQKLCPKNKTYITNYANRCLSAMHSVAIGTCNSVYTLCSGLQACPDRVNSLVALQKNETYYKLRHKRIEFKSRRKELAKKKASLKRLSLLSVENGPDPGIDHDY